MSQQPPASRPEPESAPRQQPAARPAPESHTGVYLRIGDTRQPLIEPGMLIGRSQECDLRIDDPGVSRRHAELRVLHTDEGMHLQVVDLGSTNGTRVDGQRVDTAYLVDGSRVTIGNTTIVITTSGW